ncbi:MAG: monovalent cation/hydrogen antiporter [Verrucomicrobiota bacterium]|jgi:CPA1 family monovalent cation:H+ antiporter
MPQAETVVLLFALVAMLVVIARKLAVPYPIMLVLAGLAVSFIPHLPQVKLNPDIVFYFFLPPLIYPAALFTSWRDFRRNLRPILLLAIGLVLFTMVATACVAHALIAGLPWAAAFALGAIVSPPDAVAVTAVFRRLAVPHRIEVILEGESLVNDATALVALQFAIAALMTGSFSLGHATARFVFVAVGGIAFGFVVGFFVRWVHQHLDDPPVQITISLLTPFLAYLPAERLHVSGILAVVTAGIYLGWHSPVIVSARYRLQSYAFWEMVVFLLNGFVFITIGLQLPGILHALQGESIMRLIDDALLISGAVVLLRIAWVFPASYLPRLLSSRVRARDPHPGWRNLVIVAWSGMRGVISLAAAFALPFTLSNGTAFPARNYILFFTFCVILTTLVLQGLTLPLLIRKLGVKDEGGNDEEERIARLAANEAAMVFIDRVAGDQSFPSEVVARLRASYEERLQQLRLCADTPSDLRGEIATPQYQQLQTEALQLERDTIIRLRNDHVINDDALRHIQRDLDLAEAQLDGEY